MEILPAGISLFSVLGLSLSMLASIIRFKVMPAERAPKRHKIIHRKTIQLKEKLSDEFCMYLSELKALIRTNGKENKVCSSLIIFAQVLNKEKNLLVLFVIFVFTYLFIKASAFACSLYSFLSLASISSTESTAMSHEV